MIVTVTCSPAVDYVVELPSFREGEINRAAKENIFPGGKGINVSRVLSNFGIPSLATGFLGGFTGNYILERLKEEGIMCDFVRVDGITRVNWKIAAPVETAIDGVGPNYNEQDIEELFEKLCNRERGDIICFCGKFPKTMTDEQYVNLLSKLHEKGIQFVVDTYGKRLLQALPFHPFLVKPNKEELEETLEVSLNDDESLKKAAFDLILKGAEQAMVSLGEDGLLYVDRQGNVIKVKAPQGNVVNTVGAGDSTVAGFLYGFTKGLSKTEIIRFACCAGSASAFSEKLATLDEAIGLYKSQY